MADDASRWRRLESVVHAALARPVEERAAFLVEVCSDDSDLRREAASLLKRDGHADGFLDTPLDVLAANAITSSTDRTPHTEPRIVPGSRLGAYEIRERLGAGGMGEVYRAHDTKLHRDVAVKVLLPAVANDPERLARFAREARTLASLNHPHIAQIYGLEESDGVRALVMELVEGPTLAARIARSPIPISEALHIAQQITKALEAAHELHIVHRDLKPANVKLRPDGTVKVLDFGLAKAVSAEPGAISDREGSGFLPAEGGLSATRPGVILGTAAYMAPEQARGERVDRRADLWAFGCVLFEMVSARRAFGGDTLPDVLVNIIEHHPDWQMLPAKTPHAICRLLHRCLEKDPKRRLDSAAVARFEIEDVLKKSSMGSHGVTELDAEAPRRRLLGTLPLAAAIVLLAMAIGGASYITARRSSPAEPTLRFGNPIQVTTAVGVEDFPAWSPDGRTVAYAADPSGNPESATWDIYVVQAGAGAPINRTPDNLGRDLLPSWSPDGSQIAFWSDRDGGGCYVMLALSGAARRIAAASPFDPSPPQWSADGSELGCVNGDRTSVRMDVVSLQTGQVARQIDLPGEQRRTFVTWSRDGRHIALIESTAQLSSDVSRLWILHVVSKKSLPLTDGRTKVVSPSWSPDGRVLYYVANSGATMDLWAQDVAPDGTPVGPARTITAGLGLRSAAISWDGRKLVYSQGRKVAHVWRVPFQSDRPATLADATRVTSDQAFIECIDLDRTGTQLAVSSDRAGSFDLWTLPAEGGQMRKLTFDPSAEWCPAWSPDGSTIAFYAYRTGNREVWTIPASGGAWRQITENPGVDMHPGWSADGKELLFLSHRDGWTGSWAAPLDGGAGRRIISVDGARWSPVDRRIAYGERPNVFVVSDDGRGPKVRVSSHTSGGRVTWTPDGTHVLFRGGPDHPGIYIVSADGTGQERLLIDSSGRRGVFGAYGTPTNGKYVYFTWDEDLGDLWVMNAEASR